MKLSRHQTPNTDTPITSIPSSTGAPSASGPSTSVPSTALSSTAGGQAANTNLEESQSQVTTPFLTPRHGENSVQRNDDLRHQHPDTANIDIHTQQALSEYVQTLCPSQKYAENDSRLPSIQQSDIHDGNDPPTVTMGDLATIVDIPKQHLNRQHSPRSTWLYVHT